MKKYALIIFSFALLFFLMMDEGNTANVKEQISFGALMAKKGNWKEAIFRWEKALKKDPENYRLHNNIAVAYEALGNYMKADEAYQKALKHGKSHRRIQENYNSFKRIYEAYHNEKKKTDKESQNSTR